MVFVARIKLRNNGGQNLCMEDIEQKINEGFGDDLKWFQQILHLLFASEESKIQSESHMYCLSKLDIYIW